MIESTDQVLVNAESDVRELFNNLLGMSVSQHRRLLKSEAVECIGGNFLLPIGFAENMTFVVATAWTPRCIVLVGERRWCAIRNTLVSLPDRDNQASSKSVELLRRLILGMAVELEMAPNRTVVLPEHLLSYAEIRNKLIWSSDGEAIFLWSKEPTFID